MRLTTAMPADATAGPYLDFADGRPDAAAAQALVNFRDRVAGRFGATQVHRYEATWDVGECRPTQGHIDTLCEDVYSSLASVINSEMASATVEDTVRQEMWQHDDFGSLRSGTFEGRQSALDAIMDYVRGDRADPLLVIGPSGSGKTALLAEAARRLPNRLPRAVIIARFVGATPRSANLRTFIADMLTELRRLRSVEGDLPAGLAATAEAFRAEVAQWPREPRLALLIDGLDQFADEHADLAWLPGTLPPGVRIVLSAPPGQVGDDLAQHLATVPVTLEPMPAAEGERLLGRWLAAVGRDLQPPQRTAVMAAFAPHGTPLLLRLAFEEARRWSSNTPVVTGGLRDDLPGITAQLLIRLESQHGPALVRSALGYLAASRYGLSEDEEFDLLSGDNTVLAELASRSPHSPAAEGRLPPVLWARLYADLVPYLNVRQTDGRLVFGFYHRQLLEAVAARYLPDAARRQVHGDLARYFDNQPLDLAGPGSTPNLRRLSELAYQQAHGSRWEELYNTLTDFRFLDRKVIAAGVQDDVGPHGALVRVHGGVYELQDDYDRALRHWPAEPGLAEARRPILEHFARAVRLESHNLARHPALCWQQLANRLRWASPETADLVRAEADRRRAGQGDVRWQLRTRVPESVALVRRFDPGYGWLQACVITPDGSRILAVAAAKAVYLWDISSGREVRVLRGMTRAPMSCAATRDGRYIVATTGGGEGEALVWSADGGPPLARVTPHGRSATACAVTPDGARLFTFGTDGYIREWTLPDLQAVRSHQEMEELTFGVLSPDAAAIACGGRSGRVRVRAVPDWAVVADLQHDYEESSLSCAFGADSAVLVSAGEDGQAWLWDVPSGRGRKLTGRGRPLIHCAITPDGRLLATGDDDGMVRLWRLPEGEQLAELQAHTQTVIGCSFKDDGTLLASASGDGTVCLWDVSAASSQRVGGHTQLVESVAFAPDGATLVTASTDGTVRRWDTGTGVERGQPMRQAGESVSMSAAAGTAVIAAGAVGQVAIMPMAEGDPIPIGEHGALVWAVAISADGSAAVTAALDGSCRVWDLRARTLRHTFAGAGSPMRACAITADGDLVASGDDAGTLRLWSAVTGSPLATSEPTSAGIWSVAIDASRRVLTGSDDGTVRLYEIAAGRVGESKLIGKHRAGFVRHVVWLDSGRAASSSGDGSVAVWVVDGGPPMMWQAHRGPALELATPIRKRVLISGGADGILAAWDAATGRQMASLPLGARIHAIAVHPVRPVVGCVGDGGMVHIAEIIGLDKVW
jgi:WD40 repeat protein